MQALDWSNVNGGRLHRHPFEFWELDETFPSSFAVELARTFPRERFKSNLGREGRYKLEERTIIDGGAECEVEDLRPPWRELTRSLLSESYCRFIEDRTGANLVGTSLKVRLYSYVGGDWMSPHTDPADRASTHLIYLSEHWRSDWGGALQFLSTSDSHDVVHELVPRLNVSVIFQRSESSFHAVTGVKVGVKEVRQVVIAQFMR